ncbi:hypothetical protein JAO29_12995 [Edaphobacter sp. HDX4]|uniref:hypothetical protein n=1 Tax=Edaphobacter sp. HDX4 TaxID=2794064 RepID=UPI002FE55D14
MSKMIAEGEAKYRKALEFEKNSIKIGAAQKVSTSAADELAAAVLETRGAGGTVDLMMFRGQRAELVSLALFCAFFDS